MFNAIWPTLPPGMRRCGRKEGERAFNRAMKETSLESFETGLRAYISGKEDWRAWVHFTTFCNQNRWEVEAEDYDEGNPFRERLTATQALNRHLKLVEK